jgi:queuine/archaeosine tRNA-ribosyltransferase
MRLLSIHNLRFLVSLAEQARAAIRAGEYLKTGQSTVVVERHRVARRISGGTEVEATR